MKYFSTFSGIGGFELGIIQAYETMDNRGTTSPSKLAVHEHKSNTYTGNGNGGRSDPLCVGYSEVEKYATQIYQKHFPEHKAYGDIAQINEKELPNFDLLVGGFPCQSFSIAGKRGGFNDTRGTMFFEIVRIVREKQPRLLLLENVKGLLSHDQGQTFYTIISTLDELGYDCQWQVLNSKNHGVPQNRERVFIIGHLRGTSRPQVFPFGEGNGTHLKEITSGVSDAQRIYRADGLAKSQKALGGGLGAKTGLYAVPTKFLDRNQKNFQGKYSFTVDTVGTGGVMQDMKIRRLTPTECERLQGFPDGWTEGVSDTQRYKTLGNAVTVNVVKDIFIKMFNGII